MIDVLLYPALNNNCQADKRVIVIDVLRATSTVVTALSNQAAEIIPVVEPLEAADLLRNLGQRECITGGERKGIKIEGFDLGNSPTEYKEERIKGKKIILSTTNGTKAIKWAQSAAEVIIGSFLNLQKVVEHLQGSRQDILFLCSGRDNNLCLEDLACAGMMIDLLHPNAADLTDSARLAGYVYEKAAPNLLEFIQATQHGRYLQEIGMGEDIGICLCLNKYSVLPKYSNGKITLS